MLRRGVVEPLYFTPNGSSDPSASSKPSRLTRPQSHPSSKPQPQPQPQPQPPLSKRASVHADGHVQTPAVPASALSTSASASRPISGANARANIKVWVTKARGLPFPSVGSPLVYFRLKIENSHSIQTAAAAVAAAGFAAAEKIAGRKSMDEGPSTAAVAPIGPLTTAVITVPKEVVFPPQVPGGGVPYGEALVDEWVSLSTIDREGFITIDSWYVGDDAFTKDDFVGVTMIPIATLGSVVQSGWFPFGDSKTEVPFAQCKGEIWLEIVSDQDTQAWEKVSRQLYQFVRPHSMGIVTVPPLQLQSSGALAPLQQFQLPSVAEKVEMVFDNVMLSTSGLMVSRRLYLTSFRLVFIDLAFKPASERETSFSRIHKKLTRPVFVLLSSIISVERMLLQSFVTFNILCKDFRTIRLSFPKEVSEESAANFESRVNFQTFNASSMPAAFQIFKHVMEAREKSISPTLVNGTFAISNIQGSAQKKVLTPSTPQTTWFTLPPKFRVPSSSFEEVISSDFATPPPVHPPRRPSIRSPPRTPSLNLLTIIQDAIDAKKVRTQNGEASPPKTSMDFEKRRLPVDPEALLSIVEEATPRSSKIPTPVDRSEASSPVPDESEGTAQQPPAELESPKTATAQHSEATSPSEPEGESPLPTAPPKQQASSANPDQGPENSLEAAGPLSPEESNLQCDTSTGVSHGSPAQAAPPSRLLRAGFAVQVLLFVLHYYRFKQRPQKPAPRKPMMAIQTLQTHFDKPKPTLPQQLSQLKNPLIGSMFDMVTEMKRQGISTQTWRCADVNANYTFCPTYPAMLYVPATVTDEDLTAVRDFRTNGRIPALSWYNKKLGNVIMRSSQPNVGLYGKSSPQDQKLLEMTRLCAPNSSELVIFDARSRLAARGNKFKGFGTEDTTVDYKKCRLYFLALANIHAVKLAFDNLWQAIESPIAVPEHTWLSTLQESQWLGLSARLIASALKIAYHIEELGVSILVHCSDGWDRTAQLTSLAEILLDPFYRTFEGFRVLVEKNWLSFGHKFRDRNGDPTDPNLKTEQSPIFLQFTDCVWQLTQQFPSAFEFNNEYLIALNDHHTSGWFGTFLGNCERERVDAKIWETTFSIWDYLSQNPATFTNPSFSPLNNVLIPVGSIKVMQFWSSYYLRHDKVFHIRFSHKHAEDELGQMDGSDEMGGPRIVLWIPDDAVSQCHGCSYPFHFILRRKHHCRNCGNIFCSSCVESRAYLKSLGYETPQKVCGHCYTLLNLPSLNARSSVALQSSTSRRNTLESNSDDSLDTTESTLTTTTSSTKPLKDASSVAARSPPGWRGETLSRLDSKPENLRRYSQFGGQL